MEAEYLFLCPGCFIEKGETAVCPHCGYDEQQTRSPLVLPHRTVLNNDQYLIGRVLGKPGGFGITYLARDIHLQTQVAIKEFLPRDCVGRESGQTTVVPHSEEDGESFRTGLDRFLQEARTLARMDHPNIVRVRTFFETNGTAYLVMDYYDGVNLEEHLQRQGGQFSEEQAVGLMMPILDGLREVHDAGFLHRDLKPQNIYLRQVQEGVQPILLDFGAARVALGERSRSLSVVLTEGFAPYEQYDRRGRQGPWTDVYASAATLYYLVTGEAPPSAIERLARDDLVPPEGVSAHFRDALLTALSVESGSRPQTVEEFQRQLLDQEPPAPDPERGEVEPDTTPDPARGEDLTRTVELTQQEAREGVEIDLRGGTETVRVPIQAGVQPGEILRIPGKGRPGRYGGDPGDLLVTVAVKSEPPPSSRKTSPAIPLVLILVAAVLIAVLWPRNERPEPRSDQAETVMGESVEIRVLTNDSDPDGDALEVVNAKSPKNGTTRIRHGRTVVYTPEEDFQGEDRFYYTVSDGEEIAIGTVNITVKVPPNRPPVAEDDRVKTVQAQSVKFDVLANDRDPDDDALHLVGWDRPAHGKVERGPERGLAFQLKGRFTDRKRPPDSAQLIYTSDTDFHGTDRFHYTVSDGKHTTQGTVTIEVAAVKQYTGRTQVGNYNTKRKLLGKHMFSLHYISWDYFGQATVTERDGRLYIYGEQRGRGDKKNDYVKLSGIVTEVNTNSFKVHGALITKVQNCSNGIECKRKGEMNFETYDGRQYWRMQEMTNPCCSHTDYVDVFFR